MNRQAYIDYWKTTANDSWESVEALFERKQFLNALFFAHLTLEKLLKARWIEEHSTDYPPRIHNLVSIALKTKLMFSKEELLFLDELNTYQMEGRYPDFNFKIKQICTPEKATELFEAAEKLRIWLLKNLP